MRPEGREEKTMANSTHIALSYFRMPRCLRINSNLVAGFHFYKIIHGHGEQIKVAWGGEEGRMDYKGAQRNFWEGWKHSAS